MNATAVDTLLHARWIIPVEPEDAVYENHTLAIQSGKIVAILPQHEARRGYQTDDVQELPQHVLVPGLVNAHTHAAMSLFRGLADDLPLMEWLEHHIWPAEQTWVSAGFVRDGARLAIAEMLRGGTTCFNDMYFFPGEVAQAASEIGVRASIGLIVIEFPSAWARTPDEYFSKGEQVHDEFRRHPLIRTAFAPHAPYTVSDASLAKAATLAEVLDIPIHMHVHETREEISQAVMETGMRPLARLKHLGLLSPRLQAVHMTQLTDEEITLVAEHGVHIVHCPQSNLKLASGFCPVHRLGQAGINVALGTDGAASNNRLDMFAEMRCAALLAKAVAGDTRAVPAHAALRMATLHGARVLGLEEITGSLKPGKAADVIAVDLSAIETQPLYDPVSQLVYAAGREHVTDVWVTGRCLMRNRELLTLDEPGLLAKASEWQDKIKQNA
jgi:5-methylthioadenosine/S-adenosylhomocysteine deaminase